MVPYHSPRDERTKIPLHTNHEPNRRNPLETSTEYHSSKEGGHSDCLPELPSDRNSVSFCLVRSNVPTLP